MLQKRIYKKIPIILLITFACLTTICTSSVFAENVEKGQWGIPKIGGQQAFCIEPGGPVKYSSTNSSESELMSNSTKGTSTDCLQNGRASMPPGNGSISGPTYVAVGGGYLSPYLAYVVNSGASFEDQQTALWHSRNSGQDGGLIIGSGTSKHDGSSSLDSTFGAIDNETVYASTNFATKFASLAIPHYGISSIKTIQLQKPKVLATANVENKDSQNNNSQILAINNKNAIQTIAEGSESPSLQGNEITLEDKDSPVDPQANSYQNFNDNVENDNGLNIKDKTNYDNITIHVNQETGIYTVGPFNITYNMGGTGNESFSGMTDFDINVSGSFNGAASLDSFGLVDGATGEVSFSEPAYFEGSGVLNTDKQASSRTYPTSGQDFYITFKDPIPNTGFGAAVGNFRITWTATYQWTEVKIPYTQYEGVLKKLTWEKVETNPHSHKATLTKKKKDPETGKEITETEEYSWPCHGEAYVPNIEEMHQQGAMVPGTPETIVHTETVTGGVDKEIGPFSMELGGNVWEDVVATKESKADGVNNTTGDVDKSLENILVTIYVPETGEQRSTLTDKDGNYLFTVLSPMKKFYVGFEYNGQTYLPTEYLNTADKKYSSALEMAKANLYNTKEWEVSSKGTETPADRENYDKKFEEIGSYPENYKSSNSLGKVGDKNATYSKLDLMGYTLNESGKYIKTGTQLIDGYLFDESGAQTTTYSEGLITSMIKERTGLGSIGKYYDGKIPDLLASIYSEIAKNDTETWRKLQFIEDCKIQAYTQPQGGNKDLYPVYSKFYLGMEKPGQGQINLGLWRRQEFDTSLKKDLYRVVTKINDKTAVYKYDKRADSEEFDDIHIRMSDLNYESYYGTGYTRSVYKSDYEYDAQALNHPGSGLEIYAVYKLTLRNQSQTVMGQIKEVVDYYDKAYTYREDLSWVTYSKDGKSNSISDDEFYNAMAKEDVSEMKNSREIKSSTGSRYGDKTTSDISEMYNTIYIKGLEDKKLATGETAYIYLTFQVNKENNKIMLDSDSVSKQNLAEINGYTTFYRNNTNLPNDIKKTSDDIAGLVDKDSNPGNLVKADILDGAKYEKNFEDDTDRAKGLKILLEDDPRKLNGTVWEDKREQKSGDAIVGNGIRENDETKIAGVTVQLVEKTVDGKEYIWQETTTNSDGYYSFEGYIPGDYVVRFYYGNSQGTVKVNGNSDYQEGGQNIVSYNGQDFKSTTYQSGISQKGKTDKSGRYDAYGDEKNITAQNETGTYGYNIYEADNNKNNVSDAKDLWSVSADFERTFNPGVTINERKAIHGRQSVIDYSKENVTNHVAEVLASPYQTPTYNGTKYDQSAMEGLINELINNTYMTAETGVIVAEFEYDRQSSDGHDGENNGVVKNELQNYINGHYTIANVDLGLSERPKAGLEIDKSISNIKVVLSNNNVQFDAEKSEDNLIWKDHQEYNTSSKKKNGKYEDYYGDSTKNRYSFRTDGLADVLDTMDKGLIQITMDSELMHGVTINITYKVKIKNVSEVDYEGERFYYLADAKDAPQVTTTANQVVDYVSNNLQFDSNNSENTGWSVIEKNAILSTGLVNNNLSSNVNKLNNVIQTEGLNATLKPEESTPEKTLILSRAIAAENSNDDLTYSNIVEIVKTSNTVGRRMAFSVVGNQDPSSSKADEIDTSLAERVIVLPPFGDNSIIYYTIGVVVGIILIAGIVLVNKKVLKK